MSWSNVFISNPTQRFLARARLEGSDATFKLRDYLSPGGRFPYEELASDMETAWLKGYSVYLYSVPDFLMVSAGHYGKQNKPWCIDAAYGRKRMKCFRTAAEAIRG